MNKKVKDVLKLSRMVSTPSAYYIKSINKTKEMVRTFITKPSFLDKIK
mgnify:CR=1 FL=1